MSLPELLTEAEIRDIYESRGPPMEALVVYGWDRIVTTLIAYNVLKKKCAALIAPPPSATAAPADDGHTDPAVACVHGVPICVTCAHEEYEAQTADAAPAEEETCPGCEGTGKCACGAESCGRCWTCGGTGRAPGPERSKT